MLLYNHIDRLKTDSWWNFLFPHRFPLFPHVGYEGRQTMHRDRRYLPDEITKDIRTRSGFPNYEQLRLSGMKELWKKLRASNTPEPQITAEAQKFSRYSDLKITERFLKKWYTREIHHYDSIKSTALSLGMKVVGCMDNPETTLLRNFEQNLSGLPEPDRDAVLKRINRELKLEHKVLVFENGQVRFEGERIRPTVIKRS